MSNVKIEPGQMYQIGGMYYITLRPHELHKNAWYLFSLSEPHDTQCWDYEAEIINSFILVA